MTESDTESRSVAGVFDLSRRGYDRRQVDDHLENLLVQLSEAERARRREESRANRAEAELSDLRERARTQGPAPAPTGDEEGVRAEAAHQGFGLRVEKLLRAAEQEAAETRDNASREASDLLDQARADAEALRREREQSLSAREAEIDRKAVRRAVELDERERQVTEQSTLARDEADRLLGEARVRAEQIEAEARTHAAVQHAETEKAVEERRVAADGELDRLRSVRRGVRGDLARMLALLAGELERPDVESGGDGEDDGPDGSGRPDGAAGTDVAAAEWFGPEHAAREAAERTGGATAGHAELRAYPAAGR